jgi:V8-like Glu-specific endopeptidase
MRRAVGGVGTSIALGCLLALVGAVSLYALALRSAVGSVTAPAAPSPTTAPDRRWPAVGALFDATPDELDAHFCSGSVLDSPGGDLVLTAAHCVADGDGSPARTGMLFVPGYHDRLAPFGIWTVTAARVDPRWESAGDPDVDVAVLTVTRDGAGSIEDVTGGYRLVPDPESVNDVEAIGYPDSSDVPVVRTGTTRRWSLTQLELDAPGNWDGTSGEPWLRGGHEIVGVTGGYEQGGVSSDVSYASHLGDVTALLEHIGG